MYFKRNGMIFETAYANSTMIATCPLHARKHAHTHTYIYTLLHKYFGVCVHACTCADILLFMCFQT
jgi:hypothetical protein